ncbi:hypothetical protein ACRYJU_00470 [Alloalcanivorax xenomutans]|uniref:hypothetical protein n=1 Tax=Alloalcanivorax xenomutans TaxID=1094342 RepID=UPI003D9ADC04
MDQEIYMWTLWVLTCSTQLSATVWRNPVLLSPIGAQLTVFNIVAPLSILLCAGWYVAGFFLSNWKVLLTSFVIGTVLALFLEAWTKGRGVVYTPAVLFGLIGIGLSVAQLMVFLKA